MWILAAIYSWKKAVWLVACSLGLLVMVAFIPQSHELRYFLFIPLVWAALIGVFENRLYKRMPGSMALFVFSCMALFGYMMVENREHYLIKRVDYADAAKAWGADRWWDALESGTPYCLVGTRFPSGVFLTGPTMQEFTIHDRDLRTQCPKDSEILDWTTVDMHSPESDKTANALINEGAAARYARLDIEAALCSFREALFFNPDHFGAKWQIADALEAQGKTQEALSAWKDALRQALMKGYKKEQVEEIRA